MGVGMILIGGKANCNCQRMFLMSQCA